jgi:hypothetical protein
MLCGVHDAIQPEHWLQPDLYGQPNLNGLHNFAIPQPTGHILRYIPCGPAIPDLR